jgi:hypothetical protein
LQILEEFTGKESTFEIQKMAKEKKILEHRIKQLEQTS